MLLEMLSTLSAGLFAGAAHYINVVEHPARMECGTGLAVTEFGLAIVERLSCKRQEIRTFCKTSKSSDACVAWGDSLEVAAAISFKIEFAYS